MRTRAMPVLSLLLATPTLSGSAGRWTNSPPLPQPLGGHAAAWHHGACWIAGGSWWEGDRKRIGTATIWRLPLAGLAANRR